MMSLWHLLWLLPLASSLGMFLFALMAAAKQEDELMSFGRMDREGEK
ncbi:hypothetical protein [Fictibacillus macauensis]|nr:hypothetical protein [Fictibacillus macauensis]